MRTLVILTISAAFMAIAILSMGSMASSMDFREESNSSFCHGEEADNTTCIAEEIEYFIDLGEREIELGHEDVVLVIGLSRAGKTTLVQFIANDTNTLKSVETYEGSKKYIIVDEGELQNQTIISQTFLPKLIYNEESSTAYYDCPGFNDNRNVSVEVANTYFIKMIADYAKTVKLIVVASDSTFDGNNGVLFPSVMQALVGLVRNPNKFEAGISLVPTASTPGDQDNNLKYVEGYSRFLSGAGRDQINTWPDGPGKTSAHKILDIMLQPLESIPTGSERIGYFRVPNDTGYITDFPLFHENKQFLLDLVERTEYTSSGSIDFGYSLSPHAISIIQKLVTVISQRISSTIGELETVVFETLGVRSLDVLTSDYPDVSSFALSLKQLKDKNFPECQSSSETTPEQCIASIKANITSYDVNAEEYFATLKSHHDRLVIFLDAAEGLEEFIEYSLWTLPFSDTYSRLDSEFSATYLPQREMEMYERFTSFSRNVTENVVTSLGQIESLTPEALDILSKTLSAIVGSDFSKCINLPGLTPSEYTREISEAITKIDPEIDPALIQDVMTLGTALDELKNTAQFSFTILPQNWVQPLLTIRQEVLVVLRSLAQSFSDRIGSTTRELEIDVSITLQARSSAILTSEYTNITVFAHSLKNLKEKMFPDCQSVSETTPSQCIQSMERNITTYDVVADEHFVNLKSQSGILTVISDAADDLVDVIDYSNWTKPFDDTYLRLNNEFKNSHLPQKENATKANFTLFATNVVQNVTASFNQTDIMWDYLNQTLIGIQKSDFTKCLTVPGLEPSAYTTEIADSITRINPDINPQLILDLQVLGNALDKLRNTAEFTFEFYPQNWVPPLLKIKENLKQHIDTTVIHTVLTGLYSTIESSFATLEQHLWPTVIDISKRIEMFQTIIGSLSPFEEAFKNWTSNADTVPEAIVQTLLDQFKSLGLEIIETEFRDLEKQLLILSTFGKLDWKTKKVWNNLIDGLLHPFQNELEFSGFLLELFSDLTAYDILVQDDILHPWWLSVGNISLTNFEAFWQKGLDAAIPTIRFGDKESIKEALISKTERLKRLGNLLEITLSPKTISCPTPTYGNVFIIGKFITMKNISSCAKQYGAENVYVSADYAVLVDEDFVGSEINRDSNVNLFILTPLLSVKDPRILDFDGQKSSNKVSGGHSGNVFIISDRKEGNIQFRTNGGHGTNGMNGADGATGHKGADKSFFSPSQHCDAWKGGDIRVALYPNDCNHNPHNTCHAGNDGREVKIYGDAGGVGGNGSNGTDGGTGGSRGEAITAYLNTSVVLRTSGSDGQSGVPGLRGRGGPGGRTGDTVIPRLDDVTEGTQKVCEQKGWRVLSSSEYAEWGTDGYDGQLLTTCCKLEFTPAMFKAIVEGYLQLRSKFEKDEFYSTSVTSFMDRIESNNELKQLLGM